MKIAVASDKDRVTEHFGHCECFVIFETEKNTIVRSEMVPNPGHRPGFLPLYLHELGVETIISGGIGGSAVELFNGRKIEVIVGVKGSPRQAVESYLAGELKSTGSVCHEHQHHEECAE
ncbi:MAG: dinitrogenase iron-molybdenum cofactor [Firmicutes bacterium]|nr:dinitrogenase iron-molybdenum cofactor [Bacillota bacterium]